MSFGNEREKNRNAVCVGQRVKWGWTMNRKLTLKTLLKVPGVEAFKLQANLVINEGHTRNESPVHSEGLASVRKVFFCEVKGLLHYRRGFRGEQKGLVDLLK